MRRTRFLGLVLLLLLAPACVYTNVVTPLDQDLNPTVLGDKIGRADSYSVLWLVAWGDRGTHAAAEAGGITTVHHMDIQNLVVLFGLWTRQTTIVYGE